MSVKEDLFIECPHCQEVYAVYEQNNGRRDKRKIYVQDSTNEIATDHRCIVCNTSLSHIKQSQALKEFWATKVEDVAYQSASMADVLSSAYS